MDFDKPKVYGDTSITDGLVGMKMIMIIGYMSLDAPGQFEGKLFFSLWWAKTFFSRLPPEPQ